MNTMLKSLFFLVFFTALSRPQDSLINYPGIPIVIYPAKSSYNTSLTQYQQMKQMGVYGVVAPDMRRTDYENMKSAGLKIIPQQIDTTIYDYTYGAYVKNDIVKYTDAVYTVWEAEGTNPDNGDVNLQFKPSIGEKFTNESGRDGVRTKNGNLDTLIYGPGYFQYINYKTIKSDSNYIKYTIDLELMLKRNNPNFSSMSTPVCSLELAVSNISVTKDTAIYKWPLLVSDFISSPNDWGQWKLVRKVYNLISVNPATLSSSRAGGSESVVTQDTAYTNSFNQFKIIYVGGTDLQLYVDKITVYDERGFDLKFRSFVRDRIIAQVNEYKNLSNSAVIGWYGIDEPGSIDN